jgi:hypothetical protein
MNITNVKTIAFTATLFCISCADAQPIQTLPNGSGGYNTYGRNGALTQTLPNGSGGYNTYGPNGNLTQTLPNGSGGYNSYGSNGQLTQTLPNGSGGVQHLRTKWQSNPNSS